MTIGLICEYNPFHNGHIYHINKMKELGKIMALVEEQKGIIKELNKENRHLKKKLEKRGNRDEEESESEDKSEIKDKTESSFLPQNGSLYDKKLVKPKIEMKF